MRDLNQTCIEHARLYFAALLHDGDDGAAFVQRVRPVAQRVIGDHVRLETVVPPVGENGATFVQSACAPR